MPSLDVARALASPLRRRGLRRHDRQRCCRRTYPQRRRHRRRAAPEAARAAAPRRSIAAFSTPSSISACRPARNFTEEQLGALFNASRTHRAQRAAGARPRPHRHDRAPSRRLRFRADDRGRAGYLSQPPSGRIRASRSRSRRNHPARAMSRACARCSADEQAALRARRPQSAIRLSGAFHMAIARIRGEGALTRFLGGLISRSSLVIALYGRGAASACGHDEHVGSSSTRSARATGRARRR